MAASAEATEEGAAAAPAKKWSGKKLVLFIVLPVVLLLGAVGGAIAAGLIPLGGSKDSHAAEAPAADAHGGGHGAPAASGGGHGKAEAKPAEGGKGKPAVFFDMPDLLVNLNGKGRRANFLKLRVSIELENGADLDRLRELTPRVVDSFQVYLRELRTDDLRGSAGMTRLREELLRRVSESAEKVKVRDLLFREMLVQ